MDHLACFIPAMLALGVRARAVAGDKADEFLEVAEELGETCWQMYAQTPTGALARGGRLARAPRLPRRTGRRSRARALLRGRRGPSSALYTWYDRALTLPYRTLCRPRRPGAGVCGVPRVGHGAGRRRAAQPAAPGGAGGHVRAVARDGQAALPRLGLGHVPGVRAALQGARPAAPAAQPQRKRL